MSRVVVRKLPASQVLTPEQRAAQQKRDLLAQAESNAAIGNNFMAMRCRQHAARIGLSAQPTSDILSAGRMGPEFRWVYNHKNGSAVYKRAGV